MVLQEGSDADKASGLKGRSGGGWRGGADAKGIWGAGMLLVVSRVLQSWNQTGVKNYGAPDIGTLPAHACAEPRRLYALWLKYRRGARACGAAACVTVL